VSKRINFKRKIKLFNNGEAKYEKLMSPKKLKKIVVETSNKVEIIL
jgi:hypothetical protein